MTLPVVYYLFFCVSEIERDIYWLPILILSSDPLFLSILNQRFIIKVASIDEQALAVHAC